MNACVAEVGEAPPRPVYHTRSVVPWHGCKRASSLSLFLPPFLHLAMEVHQASVYISQSVSNLASSEAAHDPMQHRETTAVGLLTAPRIALPLPKRMLPPKKQRTTARRSAIIIIIISHWRKTPQEPSQTVVISHLTCLSPNFLAACMPARRG